MAAKRASREGKIATGFLARHGNRRKCSAPACTPAFPPTINRPCPMQSRAMREYAVRRGWTIALQVREVGSGASNEKLGRNCWRLRAAARSTWCWCGDWIAGAGR